MTIWTLSFIPARLLNPYRSFLRPSNEYFLYKLIITTANITIVINPNESIKESKKLSRSTVILAINNTSELANTAIIIFT
ncbi:hypothetical protein [Lentibacillus sp. Marseille-P4043]|uniref:hypothetical protein n=1 Tax=Lentibacillus sp. Marseille-P4043 TaxID=2040293 RepID=UPI00131A5F07|nr:hypothetical protein [Lentibacillus sp. Marseille-P4043]